jgi:hypothetical protein
MRNKSLTLALKKVNQNGGNLHAEPVRLRKEITPF